MSNGSLPSADKVPPRVAIFGGGISGLTAAHELIERGFEVEVFEPEPPSLLEQELGDGFPCEVGGIARTQWSRAPRPSAYAAKPTPMPMPMRSTRKIALALERELAELRIGFREHQDDLDVVGENGAVLKRLPDLLEELRKSYGDPIVLQIRGFVDLCEWQAELLRANESAASPRGTKRGKAAATSILPESLAMRRARALQLYLKSTVGKVLELVPVGLGLAAADDFTVPDDDRRVVTFRLVQDYIPGEHGFRFFPTAYRNLRDTMKRTPVSLDQPEPFVETHRTVFDNLVPAPNQAIFMNDRPSFVLPRRPLRSVQEFFDSLRQGLKASGFTFADLNRFALELFKYMTASPKRRRTYEDVSWWDFVGGDRYSGQFQKYLKATPQALVAFQPTECDARTYGNITVQLMRDQLMQGEVVDGVLNGPTSMVWLYPWRRYLESQGVRFRRGRLIEFEVVHDPQKGKKIFPVVVVGDEIESYEAQPQRPYRKTVIVSDYYVVALPLDGLQWIVREHQTSKPDKLEGRDFEAICTWELGRKSDAHPEGAMQHLSGIQFYFPTILNVLHGHAMFADSEWGLSSISQPQFWARKRGWWDGYRSVLTVGIGNWHADPSECGPVWKDGDTGSNGKKWGWYQRRDIIAREIWWQIVQGLPPGAPAPEPILYHLDQSISLDAHQKPCGNGSRMLMNLPGTQDDRPGRLSKKGYDVHYQGLVIAGTFMQTYFRLTTMEAANESARHAVNGILRHARKAGRFDGDPCPVWNPEDYELDDLEYFRDLDEELFVQGLPHFVDILDASELPADCFSGVLGADPFSMIRALRP